MTSTNFQTGLAVARRSIHIQVDTRLVWQRMIIDFPAELARYDLQPKTVLHIGAHEGQEDATYRQIGATPIYVEANPEVFARLRENVPDRECHLFAISDTIGTAQFHVTSMDQSSSLLQLGKHAKIYPDIVETKTVEVQCTTVNELFADRHDSIDMINLDIQGAELMALRGATNILPSVSCILTEVNRDELYKGCAQLNEIDEFLGEFDFTRVRESYPYHKSWGDAFYVKKDVARSVPWTTKIVRAFERIRPQAKAA